MKFSFDGLNQQEDVLGLALERLKSISYSSPVFDDCVLSLYNTINKIIRRELTFFQQRKKSKTVFSLSYWKQEKFTKNSNWRNV